MIASRSRLRSLVIWLGISVAVAGAVIVPAGYFWMTYSTLEHELSFSAHLKANRLAKYIYAHEELWQYQIDYLSEVIQVPETDESTMRQRIFDAAGKLVLQTGPTPPSPITTSSAPLVVAGERVGTIETAASLRKTLI